MAEMEKVMKYNIDGRFPVMANWLVYKTEKNGMHYIKNTFTNEWYELDNGTYCFLKSLNGNINPYKLGGKYGIDVDYLMNILEANLLVRTEGRKLFSDKGIYLRTVYVPRMENYKSILPKLYNLLLLIGWCPMMLFGVYNFSFASYELNTDFVLLGYMLAMTIGILLHETSHVLTCLAYGGHFFEAGVMWKYVYPGAYVLIDKSNIKSVLKRIQINAAGVEMNLMLSGLFLYLTSCCEELSGFFLGAAMSNVLLAIINLTFVEGLDGCLVLEELLGLRKGIDGAKLILRNALKKQKIANSSANQKAITATCAIMVLYQVFFPLLIINNILALIGGVLF